MNTEWMDATSPQQEQEEKQEEKILSPTGRQRDNNPRMKSQSCRRQSAPTLVIAKALTRSKTLSRETFSPCVCPESCTLVTSYLSSSARSFLLYGHAQLKTGMQTQDRHLFLFSDLLVIAKAKSNTHFKPKAQARVCQLWTAGCVEEVCEGSIHQETSFVLGWPVCNCVATFSSTEQKDRWLSLLKSQIKEGKEREEPKTIPLRVYGKGISSFAATKTLPVSNSDSTNEVIRLALQQFGIIGHIKDFQLWVTSKRDNTPYPLIGHEFPFSIQMSPVSHSGNREAGHTSKHCQFILRPRPTEPPPPPLQQSLAGHSQKSLKRRRSLITWAFWRGSAPIISDLSLSATGALFGRPLQSVCVDGALPKPVMDMLAFLYHEGLWTRGIFRRPAGARAVRDLRESLDAGDTRLPLSRDHVFIMAGVFKDFLRSIPGSLLCCELHEEWLEVLDDDDEEEEEGEEDDQVQNVQRMMLRLPRENALLLRHLLAVLHTIQSNAQENQMTSFNLSVCIAPSLLWPPGAPCSPEVEGEGTRKVCELVRFMVQHCEQILGEEPASLFGGAPHRLTEDLESGDSSYDSLENELDTSSGGSPSFCGRRSIRPAALRGSLDSILTLSDGDHRDTPSALWRPDSYLSPPEVDASSDLECLSLEGRCSQRRRRSEPAIAYVARFGPYGSGRPGPIPASPASLDSLDPLWICRPGSALPSTSPAPHTPSEDSPPKDALHWGTLKVCRGLHPNSWLRKDRRLSLTQQEKEKEGEAEGGAGSSSHVNPPEKGGPKSTSRTKPSSTKEEELPRRRPSKETHHCSHHRSPGGLQFSKPSCLKAPESSPPATLVKGHRQAQPKSPPSSLFYKQSGTTFSLFKRHKPQPAGEEERRPQLHNRRGSEPGGRLVERSFTRARLPSDPGLKETRGGEEEEEHRSCLSPHSTKVVRDYLSCHPHSSQQGAPSLTETHREWLKRCSDPTAEPDFDQLLFAEESYV